MARTKILLEGEGRASPRPEPGFWTAAGEGVGGERGGWYRWRLGFPSRRPRGATRREEGCSAPHLIEGATLQIDDPGRNPPLFHLHDGEKIRRNTGQRPNLKNLQSYWESFVVLCPSPPSSIDANHSRAVAISWHPSPVPIDSFAAESCHKRTSKYSQCDP